MEYAIVVKESNSELRVAVEEALAEGWTPIGGVAIGFRNEWIVEKPMPKELVEIAEPNRFARAWQAGLQKPTPRRKMYWAQSMIRYAESEPELELKQVEQEDVPFATLEAREADILQRDLQALAAYQDVQVLETKGEDR